MSFDQKWSPSEKKVARGAYDKALEVALGKTLAEFKEKASEAARFSDMWEMETTYGSNGEHSIRCSTIATRN